MSRLEKARSPCIVVYHAVIAVNMGQRVPVCPALSTARDSGRYVETVLESPCTVFGSWLCSLRFAVTIPSMGT